MIHIFVGTKAQFIKMAPVMLELERRNIDYNFIDAGQHAALTSEIVRDFDLRAPDVQLRNSRSDINTIREAIRWTSSSLLRLLWEPTRIRKDVFRSESGICLVHGDTLTTLLSLLYAKRCRLKVAHVEAGLRSFNLLNPFPEEIVRLITMRYSDMLFAPSEWAASNLRQMGYSHKMVGISGNTILDTVHFALNKSRSPHRPDGPYVVATSHRVETIFSKSRLAFLVELLLDLARDWRILLVLHEPTQRQLQRFGFFEKLRQDPAISLLPLQPYSQFIDLLSHADFVVSDGGSIQEECNALGMPCLILRTHTERRDGINETAFLARFERNEVDQFLRNLPNLRELTENPIDAQPSEIIVDHLLTWA